MLVHTASQIKGKVWELGGLRFPPGSSGELAGLQVVRFAALERFALALLLYLFLSPSKSFFTLFQGRALSSLVHSFWRRRVFLAVRALPRRGRRELISSAVASHCGAQALGRVDSAAAALGL